jgi:hypothetical protein
MDFSRLSARRTLLTMVASGAVLLSLLFLPWYSVSHDVVRADASDWICGKGDYSCTGFDTFPLLRWLLIAGALSPLILAWIIVRGHRLSWAPGEMTMVVGFTMMILIFYNGIIDKPGTGVAESGVGLDYGYWIALLGSIGIAAEGFVRSQVGQRRQRKAPGTV